MKDKTKIIIFFTYLLAIIILVVRLFIISSHEVVNTNDFIDYYEKGESENGGLELVTDNFTTFIKEYNFVEVKKEEIKEKITEFIEKIEKENKDTVRVLVRKSGTEPLIRVMTEGENKDLVEKLAKDMSTLIEKELN